MQTLDQLKPGESGTILAVGGQGALRRRLLEMGLTPGTRVMVQKMAPSGDPIELHIRGYQLTLRKEDAAQITLHSTHDQPHHHHHHIITRRFGGRS
ncbi:MAG: FeoA family protein [Christensenella sp.]|uniref:FeoA family protein n=1 Tax=Christensenella sp. TaxID=1935934 RepID=UPI002B1F8C2A|nr:FeoA family protein [Christensenella sp.]MEA5002883.1 FeoA family protein [Christensenella sp.]